MPAVSFYLPREILSAVRSLAKREKIPVSRIIRDSVEMYLKSAQQREARERVMDTLTSGRPLGGSAGWEELHQERTEADNDRR